MLELLDCTIRDGGYQNNWEFTDECVLDCYRFVSENRYNYFEIGFRETKQGLGKWAYSKDEDIDKIIEQYQGCKIAVMVDVERFDESLFKPKSQSNVDMVRVVVTHYHTNTYGHKISGLSFEKLQRSLIAVQVLNSLGYETTVNIGCADSLSFREIQMICLLFKESPIKCLYLADTYGGFRVEDIKPLVDTFRRNGMQNIGFHAHNNRNDAGDKVFEATVEGCTMIDTCIYGLGRGAGNANTLEVVDKPFPFVHQSVQPKIVHHLYAVAANHKIHSEYATQLIQREIYDESILEKIADECYIRGQMFYSEEILLFCMK